jgi:hypothetical protein
LSCLAQRRQNDLSDLSQRINDLITLSFSNYIAWHK